MENLYPQQIEVSNWKESGVVIWIILISLKLNYLVRDELTLTNLEPCSVSREIGSWNHFRIKILA
jgi:hypothetical protein